MSREKHIGGGILLKVEATKKKAKEKSVYLKRLFTFVTLRYQSNTSSSLLEKEKKN